MGGKSAKLRRYVTFLNRVLWFCVVLGLMILMVPCLASVAKRAITGTGLIGTVEFSEYLLVGMAFLGLAYTQQAKGHIAVDMAYMFLGPSLQRYVNLAGLLITSGLAAVFTWIGCQKAFQATLDKETTWFGDIIVSVWYVRWVIPIGCIALLLEYLVEMIDETYRK